jgi:chromatin assembly factor 1 subunit B
VYDLAWSPNGEFIIAGSTDNTARVYNAQDGKGGNDALVPGKLTP